MKKTRTLALLKKRAEFVNAAKGPRFHARCFSLQAVPRPSDAEDAAPRFGFTVTKKLGGAVPRNRIRRRLKEALRLMPDLSARPGHDYVILARQPALDQAFPALQEELARAIAEIHTPARAWRAKARGSAKSRSNGAATEKKTKD
jgi:ribonuclease P protein component